MFSLWITTQEIWSSFKKKIEIDSKIGFIWLNTCNKNWSHLPVSYPVKSDASSLVLEKWSKSFVKFSGKTFQENHSRLRSNWVLRALENKMSKGAIIFFHSKLFLRLKHSHYKVTVCLIGPWITFIWHVSMSKMDNSKLI